MTKQLGLLPGELGSDTAMGPAAEGDPRVRMAAILGALGREAIGIEAVGLGPQRGIAVDRVDDQGRGRALGQRVLAHSAGGHRSPQDVGHRRLQTDRLAKAAIDELEPIEIVPAEGRQAPALRGRAACSSGARLS